MALLRGSKSLRRHLLINNGQVLPIRQLDGVPSCSLSFHQFTELCRLAKHLWFGLQHPLHDLLGSFFLHVVEHQAQPVEQELECGLIPALAFQIGPSLEFLLARYELFIVLQVHGIIDLIKRHPGPGVARVLQIGIEVKQLSLRYVVRIQLLKILSFFSLLLVSIIIADLLD